MNCLQIFFVALVCLTAFLECCVAVRFSDFEDFLMNHRNDHATTTQQPTEPASSGWGDERRGDEGWLDEGREDEGSGGDFLVMTTTTIPPTTLPRTRMTCCELGKLAGQNNFHCNPNNYGPHMNERNPNRVYGNFKRNQPSNRHAFTQVKQFSKCISGHIRQLAWEFQKCCKQAYRDQIPKRRDEMILELPISVHDNNKPSRTIFHIEREESDDAPQVPAILGVQLAEEVQPTEADHSRTKPHHKKYQRKW